MANNSLIKKGKCLNIGECENANSKKVLEIDTLEPFICPTCKTELIPVKPGGTGSNKAIIAGVLVLVLAIGGVAVWALTKDKAPEPKGDTGSTVVPPNGPVLIDSVDINQGGSQQLGPEEPITQPGEGISPYVEINKPEKGEDPVLNGKGTISYNYGKYSGDIKDGKAHGNGTLQYFKRTLISDKDDKKRYAEEGDYVMGLFRNDKVVQIEWFGKDKKLKETIQIGSTGLDD